MGTDQGGRWQARAAVRSSDVISVRTCGVVFVSICSLTWSARTACIFGAWRGRVAQCARIDLHHEEIPEPNCSMEAGICMVIDQRPALCFALTRGRESDLFSYAQNLLITLCMNQADHCLVPSIDALPCAVLKKYAQISLAKTMYYCK